MPTARYGGRRVQTEALPGVRRTAAETETSAGVSLAYQQGRTAEQLSGAVGQAMQGVAALQAAHEREKQRADDTAVMAGDTRLGKWEVQRIYDPETGAYTVRGRDAMGLPDQIATEFDQVAGEIEAGLTNDRQRAAFAKIKAQRALNLYGTISRHVSQEVQRYQAEELQNKVENGIELAVANALEPRRVDEEADLVVRAIKVAGKSQGWGPEQIQKRVGDALTAVHVGVVENLLDNKNVTAAREHYEESKALITDPKQRSRIEGMLKNAGVLEASLSEADRIIAEGGTVDEQLEKAKKLAPEVRPHVEQRIEHIEQRRLQKEAVEERDLLDKAYNLVRGGTQVSDLPATMQSRLGAHLPALDNYAAQRRRGEPTQTDQATFYQLMMHAATNPAQFAADELNLLKYRDRLSDSDFQQLTQLKANIKAGNRKATDPVLEGFSTKQQILQAALTAYGVDPTPKENTPEAASIAQLQGMLDRRIEALGGDKKVTNSEMREILDGILSVNETVPGSWWNIFPYGKSFTDVTKRLIDVSYEDIPTGTRANVEEAMRRQGLPISPSTVRDYYIEWRLRQQSQQKGRR